VFIGTVSAVIAERPFKQVRMQVDQVFKGNIPNEIEMFDSGMCDGPNLQIGRRYLMYTSPLPSGSIPSRGCTRSRAIESADQDIQFLKTYVDGKTTTHLSGTVRFRPEEPDDSRLGERERTPMKNVHVNLRMGNQEYDTSTDASGRYSVSNLPPGQYEIRAELSGYRTNWAPDAITVASKGCAVADVLMKVDRRVEGIVRTYDGHPAPGVPVSLVPARPNQARWLDPILRGSTDERGHYEIDEIPEGEFLLGINIDAAPSKDAPYPATFFPNTHDIAQASPIAFMVGASLQTYDLTAPAKLRVIRVRGRVVDAVGLPPKGGLQIRVTGPGLSHEIEAGLRLLDSKGHFEMLLCEGVRYSAYAFTGTSRESAFTAPMEFRVSQADSERTFVLDRTPDEFAKLRGLTGKLAGAVPE